MDSPDAENTVQVTLPSKQQQRKPLGEIGVNKRSLEHAEEPRKKARTTAEKLEKVTVAHKNIYGEDEGDEITSVPEYINEIFDLFYARQENYLVEKDFIDHQPEIKWNVRGVLVNWLIQVHFKFRLLDETLYLCINIMDRYLSQVVVPLSELQLVGTTALFIASKYEEVYSPALDNFTYVSKTTNDQVVAMEARILNTLQYDFGYVNPLNFLRRVSKADNSDVNSRTMAKYILEISLFEQALYDYNPSDLAAASMLLGRRAAGPCADWDDVPELVHYSGGRTAKSLQPILEILVRYMVGPITHVSLFKKYASKKYLKASSVCRSWCKEHALEFMNEEDAANISQDLEEEG